MSVGPPWGHSVRVVDLAGLGWDCAAGDQASAVAYGEGSALGGGGGALGASGGEHFSGLEGDGREGGDPLGRRGRR